MSQEFILVVLAGILYLVASGFALMRFFQPAAPDVDRAVLRGALLAALCLTAALATRALDAARIPAFGAFEVLACYAVTVTVAYAYLTTRYALRGMAALVLPFVCVVVGCAVTAVSDSQFVSRDIQSLWLALHIVTAFVGYGFLTIISALAVAYLIQDRNLKRKHLGAVFLRLPPLETLDHLMHSLIGFAFLMFSCAIVVGIALTHILGWGARWLTDPKIACTAAAWLAYAALFHMQRGADQHGRRVAWVAVLGFVCALFAFLGVHLVAQSMHDFVFMPAVHR